MSGVWFSFDVADLLKGEAFASDDEGDSAPSSPPAPGPGYRPRAKGAALELGSTTALREAAVASLAPALERHILLLECHIAGTSHRDLDGVRESLAIGDAIRLDREPQNPHDPRAVRTLTTGGVLLGYLPRDRNEVISHLLDAGKILVGRITAKEQRDAWLRVEIAVHLRDL